MRKNLLKERLQKLAGLQRGSKSLLKEQFETVVFGSPSPWSGIPYGSEYVPWVPDGYEPDTTPNYATGNQNSCANKIYLPDAGVLV